MKKIMIITVALLLVTILCGCNPVSRTEEQVGTLKVYWSLDQNLPQPENGEYTLSFLVDGESVQYTCADEALAMNICLQDVLGLELDGGRITDLIRVTDLPYKLLAWNWHVKSIGGDVVKVNAVSTFNGAEAVMTVTGNSLIYDVSPLAEKIGSQTELQKNDVVTVLVNEKDEVEMVFVSERAAVADALPSYCVHCESNVTWYGWYSETQLPHSAGHYRLEKDILLTSATRLGEVNLIVDLNGKRVEQTVDGQRIYYILGAGGLSILDSAGGGVMRSSNTYAEGQYDSRWGMIVDLENSGSTFNLYSGTLDASGRSVQYGGAINMTMGTVNMYGGTILAADPYGTGSGAIRVGGVFNMYDGKIVGGVQKDIGYESINIHGGAVIRIGEGGSMNLYGGELVGGESYTNGGIIGVMSNGSLKLYGGSISGGKSAAWGSGIYVCGGSTVKICGNPQVFGNEGTNLYLDDGSFLEVDDALLSDAKVGISAKNPGSLGACNSQKILECLISDDAAYKLVLKDGQICLVR